MGRTERREQCTTLNRKKKNSFFKKLTFLFFLALASTTFLIGLASISLNLCLYSLIISCKINLNVTYLYIKYA